MEEEETQQATHGLLLKYIDSWMCTQRGGLSKRKGQSKQAYIHLHMI